MPTDLRREFEFAVTAVRRAATIGRRVQEQLVDASTLQKKDRSPVTVADFANQAVVAWLLSQHFPQDPLVGEEHSAQLREPGQAELVRKIVEEVGTCLERPVGADEMLGWIDRGGHEPDRTSRFWTLDPIDGTKGFLRKEQYVVALALIDQGQVVLGALACPNLEAGGQRGTLLGAVRGQGAWSLPLWDPRTFEGWTIRVSDVRDTRQARFCESVESGHSNQMASARIAQRLGITRPGLRMDSQAKYAAVARGDAEIYLRLPTSATYRENIWDHAAGVLIVEEAGGRVTDVHGRALDFSRGRRLEDNQGIIAATAGIHGPVVAAVKEVFSHR